MDPHALYQVAQMIALAAILVPFLWIHIIIVFAAFIGNTFLGGMSFSWEAMAPKASKLSPLAGFKRMFGVQAYVELD